MRISDWSSDVCSSDLLFGFHAQRHDANGWMMRIIRGSITILKSEQGHSPALCREMIPQKADNTLRPARPKDLEDQAHMGFCHAASPRTLAHRHIHQALSVPTSAPAPPSDAIDPRGVGGCVRVGGK